ncbi:hypothetical protein Y032_0179g722 [Ancylostoma ceylanicum]|uniref:Uncharacterized protein n=1 Tax=Ancylostoma ceylanicum TaxID=53326 RepID=A0A016STS3_9BILA|nr:hypothetical protein Y032_0179g722 [Ancylostoma ceylanicum]
MRNGRPSAAAHARRCNGARYPPGHYCRGVVAIAIRDTGYPSITVSTPLTRPLAHHCHFHGGPTISPWWAHHA